MNKKMNYYNNYFHMIKGFSRDKSKTVFITYDSIFDVEIGDKTDSFVKSLSKSEIPFIRINHESGISGRFVLTTELNSKIIVSDLDLAISFALDLIGENSLSDLVNRICG